MITATNNNFTFQFDIFIYTNLNIFLSSIGLGVLVVLCSNYQLSLIILFALANADQLKVFVSMLLSFELIRTQQTHFNQSFT